MIPDNVFSVYYLGHIYIFDIYIKVESEQVSGQFLTKPLPPTNFKVVEDGTKISFNKSATPNVR